MRNAQRPALTLVLAGCALVTAVAGAQVSPSPATQGRPGVSLRSLLNEMIDRDALTRLPRPAYVCREASSHDRSKTDPADAKTWHSNHDYEQFIRTEENGGRHEWVIMDDDGPGAVTRFWLPLLGEHDDQVVRFYLDGSATPAIAVKFNDLLGGRSFVKPPLAFVSWDDEDASRQKESPPKTTRGVGGDLYLPIPFARHCKITLDQLPFYYVINYRVYEPGTDVTTFSMANYEAETATVERVAGTLTAQTAANSAARELNGSADLAPGKDLVLDLPAGPAAVRDLRVKVDPKDAARASRGVVFQATFDDEPTVWCPLGEFFGAGARLNPVRDWGRAAGADGTLSARWVMPYQRSGRLSLRNVGPAPVRVELGASAGAYDWDDRSLHFHATWHCQLDLKTRPFSDWNYLQVRGAGVYAGDTLTVFSPVKAWYGEGDERVYVDGEKFPSHVGTGTEDYYGYAWGMPDYFNSPFLSTPRRDRERRDDWRGYTTTSRMRLLDAIPFREGLRHDMEVWNWADTKVDYAVGTFWYARPGATDNREAQPREAAVPLREAPADFKVPGAVECESLPIAARSEGLKTSVQDAGLEEGEWSGGRQLFVQATRVGDFVELELPAPGSGPRRVTLYPTRSRDYGILRFSVNGRDREGDYDAFSPKAVAGAPVGLGTFEPREGKLLLRVKVVGSNPASKGTGCYFGLDCVVLGAE